MFKERSTHVLLFCFIVAACSAVLQYLNPGVSFYDGGYIAAILLTIFLNNDRYTWLFGGISLGMIILAAFYPQEDLSHRQVLVQHLFAVFIVAMTTLFVIYVKRLYRSIESEQRQVTALFEHATEGIVLTDEKGKIVLTNPAALQLFEYAREDLIGEPVELLIPGRFHHNHDSYRQGFYQHPGNRTMGHGRDLFARKKDGREFPVEVSLSYYRQKGILFVIAFIVDITARKKSEKELLEQKTKLQKITDDISRLNTELEGKVEERTLILREALQELERSQQELHEALEKERELNEIKSRFVSMASHEFRTPLSTVLSSAALLSRYTKEDQQELRDRHIRKIKDSVKHLNTLLEDFLSLGKLEEGKVMAEPVTFDVREFLEEIVEEMRSLAKEGQTIRCDLEGANQFVSDKRLLKNILINLIGNAVKFSPDGATIQLAATQTPESLTIAVRDQGIGISPEDQQHLFSSFFRGGNALNIEGTGLGLHIVKRYLDLLGGSIRLESVLDKGSTFIIVVPRVRDQAEIS
ncbi:MAG TPA: PAS domain-containing sensor histidine kinase [Puia sp.]|nr:PAS domain-containing sensor histidine kinase [Puia sp.]